MPAERLKDLKNQYLEYLEIERNRSPKTVENYGRYLERFVRFANTNSISDVSEDLIRKYRLHLNRLTDNDGRPLKRVTQNYHIIAIRNFLTYLVKRNIQSVAPERIELGKQEERQVTFLEGDEVARLMTAPKGDSIAALRDRAMLATLFSTGMRVSELCSLERDRVDVARGEVPVRGKGGKIRLVFLSEDAQRNIKAYLAARKDADSALFIRIPKNGYGKNERLRITPRSIQRIVQKHAVGAGIVGKHVSPHTMRHSYATDLLRNGADIRSVQAMLGHASVTTTQTYTHVTDRQLREVHERFHNRKKG
ncbi:MAG: site-specific tyrosine recombinase/integron integrase [Patescibacteria group bacterium]